MGRWIFPGNKGRSDGEAFQYSLVSLSSSASEKTGPSLQTYFPPFFTLDKDAHTAYIMRMIIIMGGVANDAEE
jgi:hypothetical protein